MRDLHPEAITEIRAHRPDLDALPDEALARLSLAHFVSLRLHVRDLGRALLATWPGRTLERFVAWLNRKLGGGEPTP